MDHTDKESQRLQSNEEVIEELTRDLESSCVKADESLAQNVTSDLCINNRNVTGDSWDIIDKEDDRSNSNNIQNINLEDVDEEFLKDREINLSEEEKKVHILKHFSIIVMHVIILHFLFISAGTKRRSRSIKKQRQCVFQGQ